MAKQILRVKKLKTAGNVKASLEHLKRENGRAPNANLQRTRLNDDSHSNSDAAMRRFDKIGRDLYMQSNSVQALEYLVTASPGAFKSEDEWHNYLVDSYEWIKAKHGEENIFFYSLQHDETTPHMSVLVRPVSERKFKNGRTQKSLSAKKFVDGSKLLSAMQTDFHESVSKRFGLERGAKKSTATHKEIKTWYAEKKSEGSGSADLVLAKIQQLERLVLNLKESKRRWRSKAQNISIDWFESDLANNENIDVLKRLSWKIKTSKILPRASKKKLLMLTSQKVKSLSPVTKKRKR